MSIRVIAMMILITASALWVNPVLHAAETSVGQKLHETYCLACHDAKIYAREKRLIQSLGDLQQQIGACGHNTGTKLSPGEIEEIVKYLNDTYYKFP
jgi:cytochrome c553